MQLQRYETRYGVGPKPCFTFSDEISQGLLIGNAPMLVEVSRSCLFGDEKYLVPALSCCISQLEILTFSLTTKRNVLYMEACKFIPLPKLKKLAIEVEAEGDDSLVDLTYLINGAPYLEEFVLRLLWFEVSRSDREVKNTLRFPHEHLKVVEFCGYYGRTSDFKSILIYSNFMENLND